MRKCVSSVANVVAIFGKKSADSEKKIRSWLRTKDQLTIVSLGGEKDLEISTWLSCKLQSLWPFDLLLVCGQVARNTYFMADTVRANKWARIVEVPDLEGADWSKITFTQAKGYIRESKSDLSMELVKSRLVVTHLPPF